MKNPQRASRCMLYAVHIDGQPVPHEAHFRKERAAYKRALSLKPLFPQTPIHIIRYQSGGSYNKIVMSI